MRFALQLKITLCAVIVVLLIALGICRYVFRYPASSPHHSAVQCADISQVQRPMVVVIPSYNNSEWYRKNLDSVFAQKYSNYRVIYIDDCSTDGTVQLVADYIGSTGNQNRCTLIANTVRRRALANHYMAVHSCDDYEIIVNLDGDDWFAHDQVLSLVNTAYENPQVWLTYGQYEEYPSGKRGHCRKLLNATVKLNCYRECEWVTSALRTFYAGLFKRIRLSDLIYQGDFFHTAADLAFMYPMLEMAAGRCAFIDEVLYIYNCQTPHNDFKESFLLQTHTDNYIRSRPKYSKIDSFDSDIAHKVGVFVCAQTSPQQLARLLDECTRYLHGMSEVHVMWTSHAPFARPQFQELISQYPDFQWHYIDPHNMKQEVISVMEESDVDYCLCLYQDTDIFDSIDLSACALWLARTHAAGFCLSVAKEHVKSSPFARLQRQPSLCMVDRDLFAWKPEGTEGEWKLLDPLNMIVIARENAIKIISDLEFKTFDQLHVRIPLITRSSNALYLCPDRTRMARLVV